MQIAFIFLFSKLPLAILSFLLPLTAKARVTPDGTTSTSVNREGNNFRFERSHFDNLF